MGNTMIIHDNSLDFEVPIFRHPSILVQSNRGLRMTPWGEVVALLSVKTSGQGRKPNQSCHLPPEIPLRNGKRRRHPSVLKFLLPLFTGVKHCMPQELQ